MGEKLRYRLAEATVVEPLVNQWSAWAQLISPLPASLHLVNFQLLALSSYLEDPPAHVRASRDPDLIGGPFVDIPAERADEIKDLLAATRERQQLNIELAKAATDFQNWLADEAQGQSLEPYYQMVPAALRGYVELTYDYYNHPIVRFFESLLYESRYYDKELQSLRLWRLPHDSARPFFMSTPRLLKADDINWRVSFDDAQVDELFKLDSRPQPLGHIKDLLGISQRDEGKLTSLLAAAEERPAEMTGDEGIRIRYFGHACILIEWKGTTILSDPFIGVTPPQGGMARYSYQDLPRKIDFVLVTHSHQDHFALETLLRLRHRIGHLLVPKSSGLLYGDMSLKLMTRKLGFPQVSELEALESIALPDGEIVSVPFLGEHGDLAHGKTAYVVRAGKEQILLGADSDCLDRQLYVNLRQSLGAIGTVFLGTESVGAPLSWGCGPLFPRKPQHLIEQTRRYHGSNADRALEILTTVGARRVYVYALGLEPWIEHLLGLGLTADSPQFLESEKLLAAWRNLGGASERLCGRADFMLPQTSASQPVFIPTSAVDCSGGRQVIFDSDDSTDAQDQFVF
ncbi:MAG TPA: MBL fold metallo-hydrolase [Pyrinomonadaceae bacterium]|nr:MBL fold metallo-hydrolase [Pyrinomonadaceae bacterium]